MLRAPLTLLLALSAACKTAGQSSSLESDSKQGPAAGSLPSLAKIPLAPEMDVNAPKTNCPHQAARSSMVTWDDAVKRWAKNDRLEIPSGQKVLVTPTTDSKGAMQIKIKAINVRRGAELIFDDRPIDLQVSDIMVEGALRMGSETCRIDSNISVEFYTDPDESLDAVFKRHGKGIMVGSRGSIDVHGKLFHQSWTFLADTVKPGTNTLKLQKPVNWEKGQKIVVVTSARRDYPYDDQNEVMTIKSVGADSKTIETEESFKFSHYAGPEYQVEVGLLSRRIKLWSKTGLSKDEQGKQAPSEDKVFGGHVMIMGEGRVAGVELRGMGQQNRLARYPLHFHLAGVQNPGKSYMTDNSIWESNWRCIVVHGTNNVVVSRNVAFDTFGHCYYLEDGVEENNEISFNLAARVKIMGPTDAASLKKLNDPLQEGIKIVQSDDLLNPADRAAAGFYITNTNNKFFGNAASGGFAGFSFPNLPKPIGPSRDADVVPKDVGMEKGKFDGNFAHTSAYLWDRAGCLYLGGLLTEGENHALTYLTGRPDWDNRRLKNEVFTNVKTALCEAGIAHWGGFSEIHNFEAHDSAILAILFGDSYVHDVLFNGESRNAESQREKTMSGFHRAFQLYDTASLTIVDGFHVANIKNAGKTSPVERSHNNCAFYNMTHSDEFTPEFMTIFRGVKYYNVDDSQKFCHDSSGKLSARNFNFYDSDGSVLSRDDREGLGPAIAGSGDTEFWKYSESCVHYEDWGLWACPKTDVLAVAALQVDARESSETYLWGRGAASTNRKNFYPPKSLARSHLTGPSGLGWHIHYASTPDKISVQPKSLRHPSWVVISLPLAPGKSCSVEGNDGVKWAEVDSFEQLRGRSENGVFVDEKAHACFLKFMGYETSTFEHGGLSIPRVSEWEKERGFVITTSCQDKCRQSSVKLPAYTFDDPS